MATQESSYYVNPEHIGSSFNEFLAKNLSEEEIKVLEAKAKLLGEIIDALKEAQFNGDITTKEQAVEFVEKY